MTLTLFLRSLHYKDSKNEPCVHSVSWINRWNLTKVAQIHHWVWKKKWLDFGDLDLIFKVTLALCRGYLISIAYWHFFSFELNFSQFKDWWVRKPSRGPNDCMFWAMIKAEGEVGYPLNRFKPPSIFILTVPRRYFCCGSLLLLSVFILWFSCYVSDIVCKF